MARTARARTAPGGVPARVREVRERIEHWRRTRERRSPMPEGLWRSAVALARVDGVYATARALGVDYASLKLRVVEGSSEKEAREALGAFVELSPELAGGAGPPTGTVVELSEPDGTKLVIRLPAASEVDIASLAKALRDRRS